MSASPHEVFDVLADPASYGDWVVGSRGIRDADEQWPAARTRLHHSVGVPPLVLRDHTEVVAARRPVMLELRARARPLPSARVTVHLQPERNGTRVTLIEDPASSLLNVMIGPLGHAAIRLRNLESLRRLKALVERR